MYAMYSSVIAFDQLPAPTNTIELVSKLGEGTYGSVHLAVDKCSGTMKHDTIAIIITGPPDGPVLESVATFKRHLKTELFRDAYSLSE